MADLNLVGPLNLTGIMTLTADSGGKVLVANQEILVEKMGPATPHQGEAPPVIMPPPPATPIDTGPNVWAINSFNKFVSVGTKYAITQGIAMQGDIPTWPGMVLPSQGNSGPTAVTINHLPINILGDQAVIFPSGGTAMFSNDSGQGD